MDQLLPEIIDQLPGIVDLYDATSDCILWGNAGFQRLTGYSVAEINQIGAIAMVLPDDREAVERCLAETLGSPLGSIRRVSYRIVTKHRKVRWLSSEKTLIRWKDETAVLSVTTDCTDQQDQNEQKRQQIRQAFEREEFKLHFQPIVWLQTHQVAGAEALARWHHPDGRIDRPGKFMPTIEREPGLSKRFCIYILSRVYEALQQYPQRFLSVNISPMLLEQEGFLGFASNALLSDQVLPTRLFLEITETLSAKNIPSLGILVHELRDAGIMTMLDDFGTGHNSLLNLIYLRAIAKIKISQQFTRRIHDQRVATIVRNIVMLAHDLKIEAVAEGIETAEQAIAMRDIGCEFGQGYFFGKPARSPQ